MTDKKPDLAYVAGVLRQMHNHAVYLGGLAAAMTLSIVLAREALVWLTMDRELWIGLSLAAYVFLAFAAIAGAVYWITKEKP